MGAKKKTIFNDLTNRNAELGFVISSSARIRIMQLLEEYDIINIPLLMNYISLHQKTINHHVSLIERSGLIKGFYIGNTYYWKKDEDFLEDWLKLQWAIG